jgi:hypothetical protein
VYNAFKISSASLYDNIVLRANIRAIYRDRYHCEKDLSDIKARIERHKEAKPEYIQGLKDTIDQRKKHKGCGIVLKNIVDKIDNIEFYTCLCRFKHPLIGTLFTLEKNYSNGILPFSGGLMDQPAQIIELLEITQDAKMKEDIERAKCQK